jgi:hypothetical protein
MLETTRAGQVLRDSAESLAVLGCFPPGISTCSSTALGRSATVAESHRSNPASGERRLPGHETVDDAYERLASKKRTRGSDHCGQFASRKNTTGSPNNEKMLTDIRAGSRNASLKTWHSSALGRASLIESGISLEMPVFWALLESASDVEAQPARVDAAVINNVTPRIRTALAFTNSAIDIPNSRVPDHSTTLYALGERRQYVLPIASTAWSACVTWLANPASGKHTHRSA